MSEWDSGADEEGEGAGSDSEIFLADRYRLLPESPLPDLGGPGAKAFVARDSRNPNDMLFARVCDPGVFPRVDTMVQLRNLREAYVLLPEEWGTIDWPPAGRESFAIVYRRPDAAPIMPSLAAKIPKVDSDTLVKSLLAPALKSLVLFERRKITHRAIRPDNVFTAGADGKIFVLGDCVAVPPGWGQSTIFETIESSMAPMTGRGRGTIGDDIYALGATMMFLSMGFCPVAKKGERELLKAKVEQGSFTALLGGEIVPGALREPIRGMLADDPLDRWTLDDLVQWTNGTLRRTARAVRDFKTDRPLKFGDREFRNTRLLASSFAANWKEAARTVRTKEFDSWLHRGLTDAMLIETISEAIEVVGLGENDISEARLVSKICSSFDPEGPLRYKEFSMMPDGAGHALAAAFEEGDKPTLALITELIQKGVAVEWFEFKVINGRGDLSLEAKLFKRLQQFLRHAGPGYGIERVLYELNPFLPCRSPMLNDAYVYSLRDLLPALDAVVAAHGRLPNIIDRHVASFIASRIGGGVEVQLGALEHAAGASANAKIGMAGLFAKVQEEYPDLQLPNLTAWLAGELLSTVSRFKSRSMRDRIEERLDQIATSGSLVELYQLLSSKNALRRDERGQTQAKREYAAALREIKRLESVEFQQQAKQTGWRLASAISVAIGMVTTIAVFTW